MTTQIQKRVPMQGSGAAGATLSVWGRVWGDVWGKTWGGGATPSISGHPSVEITKRVMGVVTETSTKRVTGAITETSTKRVPKVDPPDFV